MLSTLLKLKFTKSLLKNVLVMDAPPMDVLMNDFPQKCLENEVSSRLGIKYLSICQQTNEDITKKTVYRGAIMGLMNRLLLTIPIKHSQMNKYYNVHYLLDTGSPITTLTKRSLYTLREIEYNENQNQELFLNNRVRIGSKWLQARCSNSVEKYHSYSFHNYNVLGMDFLKRYNQVVLNTNFEEGQFMLELSEKQSQKQRWDKKIL